MFKNRGAYSFLNYNREIIPINIVIKRIDDIFKPLDYNALKRKRINGELEEHIIKEVMSYPLGKKIVLVFHISENGGEKDIDILRDTIWNHFDMKTKEKQLFLNQQVTQWKVNVFIGILFLILCLILIEVFEAFSYIHILKIIKESLLIIGWVALSEPLALILFGRQSIKKEMLYYKKLYKVPIIIEKDSIGRY